MRRLILLLAVLPSIAIAQLSSPPYNPSNVAITGGTAAFTGAVSTTGNMGAGGIFQASGGIKLQTFMTSALPLCSAGNTGMMAAATDVGGTPAWNLQLPAGTGTPAAATTFPVFCDGTNWRVH